MGEVRRGRTISCRDRWINKFSIRVNSSNYRKGYRLGNRLGRSERRSVQDLGKGQRWTDDRVDGSRKWPCEWGEDVGENGEMVDKGSTAGLTETFL